MSWEVGWNTPSAEVKGKEQLDMVHIKLLNDRREDASLQAGCAVLNYCPGIDYARCPTVDICYSFDLYGWCDPMDECFVDLN